MTPPPPAAPGKDDDDPAARARAEQLAQLRRRRAIELLALIERRPPILIVRIGNVPLSPCTARELAWLACEIGLVTRAEIRTDEAPHAKYGVALPFTPSMLIVTYTVRYYLSAGSPEETTRDVYVVYGALQATELPVSRSLGPL
jgi:hypothetical protein